MEYRKKCNVCGKIFCYTDKDVKDNLSNAGFAALESLGSLASSLGGGTIFHTSFLTGQANRLSDKVVDFNQCPYCHSRNVSFYSGTDEVEEPKTPVVKAVNINSSASAEALIKRAFIFLEDGDWTSAEAYCEACLDKNPDMAEAYLAKLMVEYQISCVEELMARAAELEQSPNYKRFLRLDSGTLSQQLKTAAEQQGDECRTKHAEYIKGSLRTAKMQGFLSSGGATCPITYGVTSSGRIFRTASKANAATDVLFPLTQTNVKAVSCSRGKVAVLDWAGNVAMYGKDDDAPLPNLTDWRDIEEICNTDLFILGRTKTGQVLHRGKTFHGITDVNTWSDITQLSANSGYALGLTKDGTVVAAGDASFGVTAVSAWKDITMVAAGERFSYGLKSDGTVQVTAYTSTLDHHNENKVDNWRDIIQIAAGAGVVVGLKADGTVEVAGDLAGGTFNASDWHDIAAVIAGYCAVFGIRKDGTVISAGENDKEIVVIADMDVKEIELDKGACDVNNWRLFEAYDTYDEELSEIRNGFIQKREEEKRAIREKKQRELEKERADIQAQLPKIKGLFAASKIKKAEARLAEITAELAELEQE